MEFPIAPAVGRVRCINVMSTNGGVRPLPVVPWLEAFNTQVDGNNPLAGTPRDFLR